MASMETIKELISYYETNNYDAFKPKVKPSFVEVKTNDGTQTEYELQPTNNKFVSDNIKEYYQKNIEFIGNSKNPKKYESVSQYESGQYKTRYEELFKNAFNNISNKDSLLELEQLIHLAVYFAQSAKVTAKARALLKPSISLVENHLTSLNTNTVANETNTEENKETSTIKNVKKEKENPPKVEEESPTKNTSSQGNSLSVLKRIAKKTDIVNREDTHTAKNFLVENEIIEVLKIIKKENKITEYELVNIAIRTAIEEAFPELADKLKPIEDMHYKMLKE